MKRRMILNLLALSSCPVTFVLVSSALSVPTEPGHYTSRTAPFGVSQVDLSWIDTVRDREVPVRIYAPVSAAGSDPFPVVVFSHGGGESRAAYGYLGEALARQGYVLVFLTHRGSDRDALGQRGLAALGASPIEDRPGDVSFVLDHLLSDGQGEKLLKGRIDPNRIAVAGQCAGATTALAVSGLTMMSDDGRELSYRDPRPKAVVALSPQPGSGYRGRRNGNPSLH